MKNAKSKEFKPSDFMRIRRPDEFSDSQVIEEPLLTKSFLEYHLESITNRKQEYLFENFCFELCQKEICPNLVPQSGPIGGGDSKRDTENYPVSKETKNYWYFSPEGADNEKWAFAFSAMKKWKTKVRDDVRKIANLDRKFDLIYFISNQNISDKNRAEIESELEKTHGIEIRILDRNWIIKKVFENERQSLAIKELNIDIPYQSKRSIGAKDVIRQKDLNELKKKIGDPSNYKNRKFVLVEDFIHAAKLARSLELPRNETEGYLDQAIRISKQVSIPNQIIRVLYAKAWTIYYWYDDPKTAYEIYQELEKYALKSRLSYELELLGNILIILWAHARLENSDIDKDELKNHVDIYLSSLKKLFKDKTGPNNSTKAKTLFYIFKLFAKYENRREVKTALRKLNSILKQSNYLLNFDVLTVIQIFDELGYYFEEYPEYDRLFDTICNVSEKRLGEVEKGRLYLNRGVKKYEFENYKESLILLEKARMLLIKEESVGDFLKCSLIISFVYKRLGLYWAARKEIIVTINQLLFRFSTSGEFSVKLILCYTELLWIELLLGRIPLVLLIRHHIDTLSLTVDPKYENETIKESIFQQDLIFSLLFLKTEISQLRYVSKLVVVLDNLGFFISSLTLKYALGYKEETKKYNEDDNPDELFLHGLIQPAYDDLPNRPIFHIENSIDYETIILGCTITLKFKNTLNSIEFAEDLLGSIEAFFSTISYEDLLLTKSHIIIRINESDLSSYPGEVDKDISSDGIINIKIPSNLSSYNNKTDQEKYRKLLLISTASLLSEGIFSENRDHKEVLDSQAKGGLFSRTLNVSPSYIFTNNIFGQDKMYTIGEWLQNISNDNYKLKREFIWHEEVDQRLKDKILEKKISNKKASFQKPIFRHKDISLLDQIVVEKFWDEAKWNGMLYMVTPDRHSKTSAKLGFVFENHEGASKIFVDLIKKVGNEDNDELIRISFIEELDDTDDYIVIFTCDLDAYIKKQGMDKSINRYFAVKQRMQKFPKTNKTAFNLFKNTYDSFEEYELIPAILRDGKQVLGMGLSIKKKKLHFARAQDIKQDTFEYGTLQLFKSGKL